MDDAIAIESLPENETQIEVIRDLMLDERMRGSWLTLAEIAEVTRYGEASISAQLRHLRKPQQLRPQQLSFRLGLARSPGRSKTRPVRL